MILPTRWEFDQAVEAGFRSDGATGSPDRIVGVQIGTTSDRYEDLLEYPANLHDYRYHVGGGLGAKRAADSEFWTRLAEKVRLEVLWWPRWLWRRVGRHRAQLYHDAVTRFGGSHFNWRVEPPVPT